MLAIGLMSGTSLDGVDVALCDINGFGLDTKITLLNFHTYQYDKATKQELMNICDISTSNVAAICSMNFKLGNIFTSAIGDICEEANIMAEELSFVASHGQTIYHIPKKTDTMEASTLQIGEASLIAYHHNVDVISDFRVMDMAANGEGAPLVPFSEYILYHSDIKNIALQNIGGIGNVTMLYAKGTLNDVIAFDTGPGNMMIDEACAQLFQKQYDNCGNIASIGTIQEDLLAELMNHPYILKKPPKSTGREVFGRTYASGLIHKYKLTKKEDIITTFTAFTAKSIAKNYRIHLFEKGLPDDVIIGGGGAHNVTLLKMIQKELPECNVKTQECVGFSSDAKEAMAFVVLGNETLHGNAGNVKTATGADVPVILGNYIRRPQP